MEALLPSMKQRQGKRGRPARCWREILEAIFWILRTGSQWRELPERYPPKSTVYERFQLLVEAGFFERLARELSEELVTAGILDLEECFIDGTFVPAKKGSRSWEDKTW